MVADGVMSWAQRAPADPDEPGMAALLTGRVELHRRCVVLSQEEPSVRFPVVWPTGTKMLAADPLVIDTPSGEVREGDTVTGGGGYLRPGRLSALTADIPRECLPDTGEVAVFNPTEAIEVEPGDDHP